MVTNFCTFGKNNVNQVFNCCISRFIVHMMAEKRSRSAVGVYRSQAGLPPGTLTYDNPSGFPDTSIHLTRYNETDFDFIPPDKSEESYVHLREDHVNWISIIGYSNTKLIGKIGDQFRLHLLTLEDILNTDHLPKIETIDDRLFLTLKMFTVRQSDHRIEDEHVSFILGKGYLLSFQEKEGDDFQVIRDRIRAGVGKTRMKGSDYLLYLLIDRIVDNYYLALDAFEDVMDNLEEELVHNPKPDMAEQILQHKKQLTHLRKFIVPLRDEFGRLLKDESSLVTKSALTYYRDVYDHLIHLTNTLESYRENMNGLMELHVSNNAERINSVMKTLTMIATIFIPLTFLAGVWGMNFHYMPELDQPWAYPAALGLLFTVGISMYIYMKRKRWL